MPKVPELGWGKLRPAQPKVQVTHNIHHVKARRISTPRPKRNKRVKAIDPTVSKYHDNALRTLFDSL